jgi:hypothetical protein
MEFTKEDTEEFRMLIKEEYNVDYTYAEAEEAQRNLFGYICCLIKIDKQRSSLS